MEFKERISFADSLNMIDEVYNTVFDVDVELGLITYLPELYDYAFRLAVAKYYYGYEMVDDLDENYKMAMDIKVDDDDLGIDFNQLFGIEKAINEKIEMRKALINSTNVSVNSKMDEIVPAVVDFFNILSEKVSAIDSKKLNKQLNSLTVSNLVKAYLKTDKAKENAASVLDSKNAEIKSFKAEIEKLKK